jgi:hypothetical protein
MAGMGVVTVIRHCHPNHFEMFCGACGHREHWAITVPVRELGFEFGEFAARHAACAPEVEDGCTTISPVHHPLQTDSPEASFGS